ncbi:MAG: hypothetical protein IJT15_04675 [Rickettsiales bacterium]|nr:hypothetical protein [Rickettsiales bacterium]
MAIKFFPDKLAVFLNIKEDLNIKEESGSAGGKGDIMSFIELIIEGIFVILVWKEFKMTRKEFEWQEEEYDIKTKQAIERKLKVICGFIYQRFKGNFVDKILNEHCNDNGELCVNIEGLELFFKFLNEFSIPPEFFHKYVQDIHITQNKENYINEYLEIVKDILIKENIMTFTDYFSPNKKEAYKKIQKCYDNIHNYWRQQITGDINDEIMIGMIWKKEK